MSYGKVKRFHFWTENVSRCLYQNILTSHDPLQTFWTQHFPIAVGKKIIQFNHCSVCWKYQFHFFQLPLFPLVFLTLCKIHWVFIPLHFSIKSAIHYTLLLFLYHSFHSISFQCFSTVQVLTLLEIFSSSYFTKTC